MNKLTEEIKEIETETIAYDLESEGYFEFKEGKIPILISAPHGAKHFRDDDWKEEDQYTSSIAIKLGEITGAHVIYVKNKTREDSNYLERTKYKERIKEVIEEHGIKFLMDLHGVDQHKPFKICVGTGYDENEKSSCPAFKDIIEDVLKDFQAPPIFNRKKFKAKEKGTVTSFARRECGVESAQFEINAAYRILKRKPDSSEAVEVNDPHFRAAEENVLELFGHLKKIILRIKEEIETRSPQLNAPDSSGPS
jgi:hypothetical protein